MFLTRRLHDAFVIDELLPRHQAGDTRATLARQAFLAAEKTWSLAGVLLRWSDPTLAHDWHDAWRLWGERYETETTTHRRPFTG